jgi:L-lactate permease
MPFLKLNDLLFKTGIVCPTCRMEFVVDRSLAIYADILVLVGVVGGAAAIIAWNRQLVRGVPLSRLIAAAVGLTALVWIIQYVVDARLVRIREAHQDEKIDTYLGGA